MKNILRFFILITFFGIPSGSFSQDIHFSQVEFSPLTLNPGLVGANSTLQGIVNYRNQWSSVGIPYRTFAASLDARFNENKRNKNGIIAGGITLFNDQSGDLNISTNNVNIYLAYHLILDRKSTLGIGMYGGFGQRTINPNFGRWSSQYDGMGYNSSISSGETFNSPSFSYGDVGAGIVYTYKKRQGYITQNDQRACNIGFAAYHVNKPAYSFLNESGEQLYVRFSMFANATIGLQNSRGSILPGLYIQRQKSSMEVLYGLYYKYQLNEGSVFTGFNRPIAIYFGLFNRFKDALVGKFMLELDQFSTGFAYDVVISGLTEVAKAKGGFELFLRFNIGDGGGFRNK
jgi:type IX secretion system PorP/SprF family membrane protein